MMRLEKTSKTMSQGKCRDWQRWISTCPFDYYGNANGNGKM